MAVMIFSPKSFEIFNTFLSPNRRWLILDSRIDRMFKNHTPFAKHFDIDKLFEIL